MTTFRIDLNRFKLEYYFNLYKDYPSSNRDTFRLMFTKKHGKGYKDLNKLLFMINNYQVKKYSSTLDFK